MGQRRWNCGHCDGVLRGLHHLQPLRARAARASTPDPSGADAELKPVPEPIASARLLRLLQPE